MENTMLCRCGRCNRVLKSVDAIEVGLGAACCKKALGKTIKRVLKERQEEAASGAHNGDKTE